MLFRSEIAVGIFFEHHRRLANRLVVENDVLGAAARVPASGLATGPHLGACLLGLAEVYKQMDKYEEGRQALLEATRIQTDDIERIYELAAVEAAQGDWEKAVEPLS